MRILTPCIVLLSLTSASLAEDAKPDPREELATAIPEAIRLLEAKKHSEFLENFVNPEDFKRITSKVPLADFAKKFAESDKSARLVKVLKLIKTSKPEYNDAKTTATYKFDEAVEGTSKKQINFVKVEKYWYISN